MGRIVVSEFMSLDGVVEDPAAWVGEVGGADAVDRVKLEEAQAAAALLLGRRSYEFLAGRWPSRTGPLADRLNALPKHVVASAIGDVAWGDVTVVSGDVAGEVAALRRERPGEIVVYGSLRLVRTLVAHDLVDELRLTVCPVVLGAGARLLEAQRSMRLLAARHLGDVAVLRYEPVSDSSGGGAVGPSG